MSEQRHVPTVRDPDSAIEALRLVAERSPGVETEDPALVAFLRWLATSSRDGTLPTGAERERLVAASAPLLVKSFQALDRYVYATARTFNSQWYGEEWAHACETRSRVEFLFELYRGSDAQAVIADAADPGDLDNGFRGRGQEEGYLPADQIPPGTPPSHWWWWYPDPPPAP
jgi:hypothetical protein